MPRLEAVVINCRQPAALAFFYGELLGLPVNQEDEAAIAAGTLGSDESVLLRTRDALHVWADASARAAAGSRADTPRCAAGWSR